MESDRLEVEGGHCDCRVEPELAKCAIWPAATRLEGERERRDGSIAGAGEFKDLKSSIE